MAIQTEPSSSDTTIDTVAETALKDISPDKTRLYFMLICLRDELYEGSWAKMTADLRDRLKKRPYTFKLADRIEKDMELIEEIQAREMKYGVKYIAVQNTDPYKNQIKVQTN